MNYKRLLIQTIPTAGAIGMAACAPTRGGGGGGGGDDDDATSNDDIFGAWELRSYGYDGEEAYQYPSTYTDEDGCTVTTAIYLEVAANLTASMTSATDYEACSYYSEGYVYRYPGAAQDLGTGMLRIVVEDFLTMDCPENPGGNSLSCSYDEGEDSPQAREVVELTFQRVNANVIPEPTPSGDDDDDVPM